MENSVDATNVEGAADAAVVNTSPVEVATDTLASVDADTLKISLAADVNTSVL